MTVAAWFISLLLLFLGGWAMITNWVIPLRPKGGSLIPVIGGVFVAIAFVTIPFKVLHGFWWLPLIVDLGCLPLLVLAGGHFAWRSLTKRDGGQGPSSRP
jgi:hypothetical protein